MQSMSDTHIHSEFNARMKTESRLQEKEAQEINQSMSDVLTDRDFDSVDYSFNINDDIAELEATFVSEKSYNQDTHEESIELMVGKVFDANFQHFDVDFKTRRIEVESEDADDE